MRTKRLKVVVALVPYSLIALFPLFNLADLKVMGLPLLWFWSFIYATLIMLSVWTLYLLEKR